VTTSDPSLSTAQSLPVVGHRVPPPPPKPSRLGSPTSSRVESPRNVLSHRSAPATIAKSHILPLDHRSAMPSVASHCPPSSATCRASWMPQQRSFVWEED